MRLEFRGGGSSKFWEPKLSGRTLTVRFGKIGTEGQTRDTVFATAAAAKAGLAKLVAEKTGKGYTAAKAPKAAKAAKASKANRRREPLLALASALGGAKAASVGKRLALAVDDTVRYVKSSKHELFEDWEDELDEVPWLALIEELKAVSRAAEVDWKEAGSEVLAWLEKIGGAPAKQALKAAHEPALDERRTDEALALFGKLLGAARLALVELDKSSDSFALMIVATPDVARLAKLARAAGGRIEHWTGKNLARLEAERLRKLARDKTQHPWRKILVAHEYSRGTESAAENVLYKLRHDHDGSLAATIRAALAFVPARDKPLVELALALNEKPASKLAKTTRDPALCLRALNNVRDTDPAERLWAASVLAGRLKIKPDRGKLHRQLGDALNLWADERAVNKALGKLSSPDRERLARLADGLLGPRAWEDSSWSDGARAMGNVGDATSLEILVAFDRDAREKAAAHARKYPSWSPEPWGEGDDVPKAIRRLRARLS